MTRSPRSRTDLSDSLHRQLNMYALAAGAAGVGAIALAQPAEAKVVYTPAHLKLGIDHLYAIDLDHDGTGDLYLSWRQDEGRSYVLVSQGLLRTGGVAVTRTSRRWALAIYPGAKVGPARQFYAKTYRPFMATAYATQNGPVWHGPWANGGKGLKNRYLGIKFKRNAQFHYGWARLTVSTGEFGFTSVLLTGYAYETIPGKAIIAGATKGPDDTEPTASLNTRSPEPATLGMLALGAPGLAIWRREESLATPESTCLTS